MDYLFVRLIDLRNEYFNDLDGADIIDIRSSLDEDFEYSSSELIQLLMACSDVKRVCA